MALKHVILAVLGAEPSSGYDIVRAFDQSLGFFWTASHQQIYRDLKGLADLGLVAFERLEQDSRPDKKLYRLTQAGRAELHDWFEAPIAPRVNNDLLVKLLAIDTVGATAMRGMLAGERTAREQRLATFRALEAEHFRDVASMPVAERMIYLALRRGILGEEDWLRWIAEADILIGGLEG
ncbi:MAG: PadR family transcriptional regulator [Brevundimonas sp.]|uniref:PadR family transcriptional regulator n=1 Tax=Brevundimonas sp. TaxID=1871086 RepID=UPI0025BDA711|nr:PadR family transcriptional regulator [Brevundimonas sp.]MBX3476957.1 PadR family transcriptional regulator [Brevundimonas sp.]